MATERKLVGYLSDGVKSEYSGEKVYRVEDSAGELLGYQLGNGKAVGQDLLEELVSLGLLRSPSAMPADRMDDLSSMMPDRVDPEAEDGPVYITDREVPVARISYHAGPPIEGQLVFRTNLPSYFVTDRGYVLDSVKMQTLGGEGHLLIPTNLEKMDPFGRFQGQNQVIRTANEYNRRQAIAGSFFALVIILALAAGYLMFKDGIGNLTGGVGKALSGPQSGPATPEEAQKGLGESTGGIFDKVGGALDGKDEATATPAP